MEIDVIETSTERTSTSSQGIVDVSNVPTAQLNTVASGEPVYLERRGDKTYLVPA